MKIDDMTIYVFFLAPTFVLLKDSSYYMVQKEGHTCWLQRFSSNWRWFIRELTAAFLFDQYGTATTLCWLNPHMPQTLATIRTEIQLVRRGVECKAIQKIHGMGLLTGARVVLRYHEVLPRNHGTQHTRTFLCT